jgi:hypothetical protein
MNRATFGNIQKPGALEVGELTLERERSGLGHGDTFLRAAAG